MANKTEIMTYSDGRLIDDVCGGVFRAVQDGLLLQHYDLYENPSIVQLARDLTATSGSDPDRLARLGRLVDFLVAMRERLEG